MNTFTATRPNDVHSLCLCMLDACLDTQTAFAMLKSSLVSDYDFDKVELELYRTSIDFRNGLNKESEQWVLNLREAWANG